MLPSIITQVPVNPAQVPNPIISELVSSPKTRISSAFLQWRSLTCESSPNTEPTCTPTDSGTLFRHRRGNFRTKSAIGSNFLALVYPSCLHLMERVEEIEAIIMKIPPCGRTGKPSWRDRHTVPTRVSEDSRSRWFAVRSSQSSSQRRQLHNPSRP